MTAVRLGCNLDYDKLHDLAENHRSTHRGRGTQAGSQCGQDDAVPETRWLQQRFQNRVEGLSFDRGFHSPENQDELAKLVKSPCLPKPGCKQVAAANLTFRAAQQREAPQSDAARTQRAA